MRHRFHALCSYFAMFPESFAEHWISRLSEEGDTILDPFCGRGTAPFQALLMGRNSIGCDTNAVAYCISRAKTNAPPLAAVMRRIGRLEESFDARTCRKEREELPKFFHFAFHKNTLSQLIHVRQSLDYRKSDTDCMVTALVLGSLHGEMDTSTRYLSNQMPHTISTKPEYSVRFWQERGLIAPPRQTFDLLRRQAKYRYESERPSRKASVYQMDMRELPRRPEIKSRAVRCVITSPPYFDVTNYAEDQWLRMWFLGGPPHSMQGTRSTDDRHGSMSAYWSLLADMWRALGLILDRKSDVVIRLGASRIAPTQLVSGLEGVAKASRRKVRLVSTDISKIARRQTDSFRPGSAGCKVEVDCHFVMT